MTLNQFPPEVLATIFKYLTEYEVKTASDVNTRWRDIASNWVLVPRGHLLLHHPPVCVPHQLFHTIHVDGNLPIHHHFHQQKEFITNVSTVVLYGVWNHQRLAELSDCLETLADFNTLEISGASPPHAILDFLLIRHEITKLRCFLDNTQSKPFRKVCERLRTTHGLFEEVIITKNSEDELEVYVPKSSSVNYPEMDSTTSLTIHPARLTKDDFDHINSFRLKSLTLNHPKHMPENFLTNMSKSLRKMVIHNAKNVSHDTWTSFFHSPVVNLLENLSISGQNQIDSSIFDHLAKNPNLRRLYLQMHCPCADQCSVESLLSWCPNIEVLVLYVPFSSSGVYDLVNIDRAVLRKLRKLKILFQLTPGVEPKSCLGDIRDKVRERLTGVDVDIEYRYHQRQFLCDDDDDFE